MVGTGPAGGCNGNDVASFAGDNGRDIGGGEDSAVIFPLPLSTFGSSCSALNFFKSVCDSFGNTCGALRRTYYFTSVIVIAHTEPLLLF